ncbi:MAG: acyl-CoA thioesterase [Burkholderiaceae bacterium]
MRFDLPEGLRLVHEMRIPVRWGDLDAMGHVNNTLYFRYFEILRVDWLGRLDARPDRAGVGPVMANGFCNFIRQIGFPGDVVARHYVAAPGGKSLDTYFTLAAADAPEAVAANGGATLVWFDFPGKKTVALPGHVRRACS